LDESKADRLTFMANKIKMIFLVNICLIMIHPELFSQPDESKRVKKMLELIIPSLFRLG
jgi:hypothetical protein